MPGACSCGDLLAFCDDGMGGSPLIIKDLDLYPQPPTNTRSLILNSEEPYYASSEVASCSLTGVMPWPRLVWAAGMVPRQCRT